VLLPVQYKCKLKQRSQHLHVQTFKLFNQTKTKIVTRTVSQATLFIIRSILWK